MDLTCGYMRTLVDSKFELFFEKRKTGLDWNIQIRK